MSFYIVLHSSVSDFVTTLIEPLQFDDSYCVALVDIVYLKREPERSLDILSSHFQLLARTSVPDSGKPLLEEINGAIAGAVPRGTAVPPNFFVDPKRVLRFRPGQTRRGAAVYVHLSDPLSSDLRRSALGEIDMPGGEAETKEGTCCPWLGKQSFHVLYVYCDLVSRHMMEDRFGPLLRAVPIPTELPAGELFAYHFRHPLYVPVDRSSFQNIRISLSESFKGGYISLILHFRPS